MPVHTTHRRRRRRGSVRNRRRATISGLLFLAPFMLVYAVFLLYPVLAGAAT